MATEENTGRNDPPQSDLTLSELIEAARLTLGVLELAADAVDDVALGRDITDSERQQFADADAEHQAMVVALRAWPAGNLAEAVEKVAALADITDAPHDPDAVRANHAALVVDVARIAGVVQ